MKNSKTRYLCQAAMVAALYVVLTWLSAVLGLSSGAPQCRLGEAVCVLPLFMPAAVPGLGVGCFVANLLFSPSPPDLIFGTLATVLGALGCYAIGRVVRSRRWPTVVLATLPNVVSNSLIVPLVLKYAFGMEQGYVILMLDVLLGELIAGTLLGTVLGVSFDRISPRRYQ